MVADLLTRLPEGMPLLGIAKEVELLAGIEKGREQAARGEGLPAADVRKLVDSWASLSS